MTGKRRIPLVVLAVLVVLVGYYIVSTAVPCGVPAFPISPERGGWAAGTALPTPRSELTATVLAGKIYVAGGLQGATTVGTFEVYDPATGTWRAAPALPMPLHHTALAASSERIYLTGGFRDLGFQQTSAATWVYDPQSATWQQAAALPGPRAAHTMAAIGGKLYVVGGVPDATALWAYDPARDTWDTRLAPMPTAREHLTAAVIDDKLYVIGWRWAGVGNVAALEVYDPLTDAWAQLPAMPSARGGLTAGVIGDRIYVAGGENPWARLGSGCTYHTLEAYDTASGQWVRLDDLPTARHGLASGVVAGQWYLIGGATRPTAGTLLSVSNRVERYTPAADS